MTKWIDVSSEQGRLLASRLLERVFPGRDELMQQLATANLRVMDGGSAPYWAFEVEQAALPAGVLQRTPLDAEGIASDADGGVIHLSLHVADGFLSELEMFREDGQLVQRVPAPNEVTHAYPD